MSFEEFVTLELPQRAVTIKGAAEATGDPNVSAVPKVQGSPIGTYYVQDDVTPKEVWIKTGAAADTWVLVGAVAGVTPFMVTKRASSPYPTIQAAITAAAAVASSSQRQVVQVGAGEWTENITMANNVDVRGMGVDLTKITGQISAVGSGNFFMQGIRCEQPWAAAAPVLLVQTNGAGQYAFFTARECEFNQFDIWECIIAEGTGAAPTYSANCKLIWCTVYGDWGDYVKASVDVRDNAYFQMEGGELTVFEDDVGQAALRSTGVGGIAALYGGVQVSGHCDILAGWLSSYQARFADSYGPAISLGATATLRCDWTVSIRGTGATYIAGDAGAVIQLGALTEIWPAEIDSDCSLTPRGAVLTFDPTTPGNWNSPPQYTAEALDELAARVAALEP